MPNVILDTEVDDLFAPRQAQAELMPTSIITCRVCGMRAKVTIDNVALLCGPCRVDIVATRSHVESTLAAAETRWQAHVEAFDVQAERPSVAAKWAQIQAARLDADPKLFAEAWRRRKAEGGALGALLQAKDDLDELSDEIQRRRAWAAAALEEIDVYANP